MTIRIGIRIIITIVIIIIHWLPPMPTRNLGTCVLVWK